MFLALALFLVSSVIGCGPEVVEKGEEVVAEEEKGPPSGAIAWN